jgi:hypothetical protein
MTGDHADTPARIAVTTILLATYARQRAPESLCDRVREVSVHGLALVAQNVAYAGRFEIDLLQLTLGEIDLYERALAAQIDLCKARLGGADDDAYDCALQKATEALMRWMRVASDKSP